MPSACARGQTQLAIGQNVLTGAALGFTHAQDQSYFAMATAKMAAITVAEQWASEHRQTLQALLSDPSHSHGVRDLLPGGDLRVAHIVGLVGELSTSNRVSNPWKHYEGIKACAGTNVMLLARTSTASSPSSMVH